ncbi:MAG: Mth938-like domain-containing protein [Hyphomicrobiales bacterium]
MSGAEPTRFLPGRRQIDAYGSGGFRFGGMSHRGSILALPSGMRAWPVASLAEIDAGALAPILAEAGAIEILLIGAGADPAFVDEQVRSRLAAAGIRFDVMQTGAAARTYNVLLAEDRRVAAALIAVG